MEFSRELRNRMTAARRERWETVAAALVLAIVSAAAGWTIGQALTN